MWMGCAYVILANLYVLGEIWAVCGIWRLYFMQHVIQVENRRQLDLLQLDVVVFVADAERQHVALLHGETVGRCLH